MNKLQVRHLYQSSTLTALQCRYKRLRMIHQLNKVFSYGLFSGPLLLMDEVEGNRTLCVIV